MLDTGVNKTYSGNDAAFYLDELDMTLKSRAFFTGIWETNRLKKSNLHTSLCTIFKLESSNGLCNPCKYKCFCESTALLIF